jgi:hypothetical protein
VECPQQFRTRGLQQPLAGAIDPMREVHSRAIVQILERVRDIRCLLVYPGYDVEIGAKRDIQGQPAVRGSD